MKNKIILSLGIATLLTIGSFLPSVNLYTNCNGLNNTVFAASVEETVKVNSQITNYENDYAVVNLKIPVVSNSKNEKAEKRINNIFEKDINKFKDQLEKEAEQDMILCKKDEIPFRKYEITVDYQIHYNKGNLLSLCITYYQYTGGNHGLATTKSYNIDVNAGRKIPLSKFFNKYEQYIDIITNFVNNEKNLEKNKALYFDYDVYILKDTSQFYIKDGSIAVYFQPYEIGPYSTGTPVFEIPFTQFKNGVNTNIQLKPEAVIVDTKEVKKETETLTTNLEIPVISKLKNQVLQNKINNFMAQKALEHSNSLVKGAKEFAEDCKKYGFEFRPYAADTYCKVLKNEDNLLSIRIKYYAYTGGAHGNYVIETYNIDLATGKFLELKDIFNTECDYKQIINKEIIKEMDACAQREKEEDGYYSPYWSGFESISDNQVFYIDDGNIVICFQPYEISCYAAGAPEIAIPFSAFNGGIKQQFLDK